MNSIKMILASYCLLASASNLFANPALTAMRSAIGSAKIVAGTIIIHTYLDQVARGPKDLTKLPNFSSEDIANSFDNYKVTAINTFNSLRLNTSEELNKVKKSEHTTEYSNPYTRADDTMDRLSVQQAIIIKQTTEESKENNCTSSQGFNAACVAGK